MQISKPRPPEPQSTAELEVRLLGDIYRKMVLIRSFELKVNELFLQGRMPGTIHLSHGQEATTVGACSVLEPADVITLTHRGHGQALAKGVSARALLAELFGKQTGCCGGRGGSLHVGDMSVGALPAIAIVGASSPIAAGMAFAFQRDGSRRIAVNFHGEGTANKGDWHEALNLAAVWQLPVVFLCENNLYGVSTHASDVMRVTHVADRAAAYGMPGVTVYGNDPLVVRTEVTEAVTRARNGDGPTLVECLTYRRGGHKRDDPATYRPSEEVDAWLAADPLPAFRDRLLADERFTAGSITEIEDGVDAEIAEAVAFADSSPDADPESVLEHLYG